MKLLLVLISSVFITLQPLDLNSVRTAYKEAAQEKTKVEQFYNSLSKITKNDKIELVAYKGASITLLARQSKTIKKKKERFIEGVSWVNFAINQAPNNIEIRFIRLGIQENTPKLLKYKENIEEDKLFLKQQYRYIKSTTLKNHISDYILQSKVFSDEEKSLISKQ